jgi:hypothetical protein
MHNLQQICWRISIATECALLFTFAWRGLARRYPLFCLYLGVGLLRSAILSFMGDTAYRSYAIAWTVTGPIPLVLLTAAAVEIVQKVPEHYRSFGDFGRLQLRRILQAAIALALLSTVCEAAFSEPRLSLWSAQLFVIALTRITTCAIAVYLIFLAVFVSRVPVTFRRNLVIHSRLFASYVSLQMITTLWAVIAGGYGSEMNNVVLTLGSSALFVAWALLLQPSGETLSAPRAMTAEEIADNEERRRKLRQIGGREPQ